MPGAHRLSATPRVGQCGLAAILVARREALMATKTKGGRSIKKVAARSLKEKRLDKKSKTDASDSMANQSVDRAFGR